MAAGTRDRMVGSAVTLLADHGVSGTSFARVLAACDGPRGSIGHHFPGGKAELVEAAVTRAGIEVADRLRAGLDAGATPGAVVGALCDQFANRLARSGFRAGCPVASVAFDAHDDPELSAAAAGAMTDWAALLSAALRDHGVESARAEDLAWYTVAAVEGAVLVARARHDRSVLDATRRLLTALLDDATTERERV